MDGGVERPPNSGRVSRQRLIVLGVVLTLLGGLILLLAPDLTGPLVHDLPFLGGCLISLFLGGILLGVGYGRKPPRRPR